MKYHIIGSGKIKEPYLAAGISEFLKRLTPYGQVKITETAEERMPENPSAAQKRQVLEKEGTRLLKYVREGSYLFVLDVAGDLVSSEELAETLAALSLRGYSEFSFIIGGPLRSGAQTGGYMHFLRPHYPDTPNDTHGAFRAAVQGG